MRCVYLALLMLCVFTTPSTPELTESQLDNIMSYLASVMPEAKHHVTRRDVTIAEITPTEITRDAASVAQRVPGTTPGIMRLSTYAQIQLHALELTRDRFTLSKRDIEDVLQRRKRSVWQRYEDRFGPDPFPVIAPGDECPIPLNTENNNCNASNPYSAIDGVCNNLYRPRWGSTERPLARLLDADYGDGMGSLRRAKNGDPLPSARLVSLIMASQPPRQSEAHNVMHMTFGQFLDHDMDRTATSTVNAAQEPVDVACGSDGCTEDDTNYLHCRPIHIPAGDPVFNKSCIKFVRSAAFMGDCNLSTREQANMLTSFIDASQVYGSSRGLADSLRETYQDDRGRLLTTPHQNSSLKDLLPQVDHPDCRGNNDTIKCFKAGDGRVNEQVGLMAMHTLFMRFHNFVEKKLHKRNPGWSGEKLYQEARKIVSAASQHIAYNEYVPTVLGPTGVKRYCLELIKDGFFTGYNNKVNADVTTSFSTAAFRFGHSQIGHFIRFISSNFGDPRDVHFSKVFNRPYEIYNAGVDAILLGMVDKEADVADIAFSESITSFLFSESPPTLPGVDLFAINTQRGRDHGIPGYMKYREYCGLKVVKSFNKLQGISKKARGNLALLYKHVDDIDLFAGGMAEEQISGGMVGPTFACIIGQQFQNTRAGDRFWYEREDPVTGFTLAQLNEIRKYTLARVMCDNLDNVETIQKFVNIVPLSAAVENIKFRRKHFYQAYHRIWLYKGDNNERRPCSEIPEPDFSAWKE